MTSLKEQLIRLGEEEPTLRPHLRSILDKVAIGSPEKGFDFGDAEYYVEEIFGRIGDDIIREYTGANDVQIQRAEPMHLEFQAKGTQYGPLDITVIQHGWDVQVEISSDRKRQFALGKSFSDETDGLMRLDEAMMMQVETAFGKAWSKFQAKM